MATTVRVKNQKISKLNSAYTPSAAGDFDVKKYMEMVYTPVFRQPMVPTAPVDIVINGQSVTDDEIWELMFNCCTGTVDPDSEGAVRSLLHQTLASYNVNTKLLFKEMFAVSAGTEAGLPEPDGVNVHYTPLSDVIPAASKFMQGTVSYEAFFASFAYYFRIEAFGIYFVNEQAFDDFKAWFQAEVNILQSKLNPDCLKIVSEFMKLNLSSLSESFRIRNVESDNNDEFSFARVFIALAMRYFGTTALAGLMPFDADELFCPKNIILLNVERYAHSTTAAIAQDLKDIKQAIDIANQIQMVSNNKLSRLAPVARALRKNQAMAANSANQRNAPAARAARTPLRNRIMTKAEYLRVITIILKKMNTEARTMNVYRMTKNSFAKPNRRNPDDFNIQGKITSTKYWPDIHIYLDTSGSVLPKHYEAGLKLCMQLAKKLNTNLYFNSFSHHMSQTWLIECKDRSLTQIYEKFQKIPKVTGGTDYEQIWHFINRSKVRRRELSIILTDFEWRAPSKFVAHPPNLYYMPFANVDWSQITYYIGEFMKSMLHNDPLVRGKILA
jgi:hypothetical protein